MIRATGSVTEGMGKGKEFIGLDGYAEQFRERLGYDPFPGTLNLSLTESLDGQIETLDSIRIEEWERNGQSFGAVDCYPAAIQSVETNGWADEPSDESTVELDAPVHLVVPDRTGHDATTAELIAPVRLRDALALDTDSTVDLRIESAASDAE